MQKLVSLCCSLLFSFWAPAQNPFVTDLYTADPSAHVWKDGRLYVYPSHDVAPPRGCDLMDKYHVYSTDDMVHWKDHGEILEASEVPWGRPEGGFMWAPDCAYKNGTYYFYFPHPTGSGKEWNNTWKIGVATSKEPAAHFTVQGYIKGLKSMIDPCIFVDDDGQAYLYYGGGGHCEGGKLKDNMMEIDGAMQPMPGLEDFHEATWVHKRNGTYYLSYSDNHDSAGLHNRMRYATGNSPLGPWTYRGIFMDPTDSYTNHGSIVEYKGQWYAFYHTSVLSHFDWLRSICVDKLFYNPDGTIQKVIPTTTGPGPAGPAANGIIMNTGECSVPAAARSISGRIRGNTRRPTPPLFTTPTERQRPYSSRQTPCSGLGSWLQRSPPLWLRGSGDPHRWDKGAGVQRHVRRSHLLANPGPRLPSRPDPPPVDPQMRHRSTLVRRPVHGGQLPRFQQPPDGRPGMVPYKWGRLCTAGLSGILLEEHERPASYEIGEL
jgi:arabinoxylan arabinofuranohydrolase